MKVRDVMSRDIAKVSPRASCVEAAAKMAEANVGLLVVSTDGDVAGIITDRDLITRCLALGADPREHSVDEYMNGHPTIVEGDLELRKAVQIMRDTRHHRLPVVENGKRLIGILALDDVAFDLDLYAESFLSVAGQYSRRAREIEGALGE